MPWRRGRNFSEGRGCPQQQQQDERRGRWMLPPFSGLVMKRKLSILALISTKHHMKISTRQFFAFLLASSLLLGSLACLSAAEDETPIIEVRVYKIKAGMMDEWERFFHDKLVEPQEKAGIKVLAAYRTLEDEDLFVWVRQFSSKANMEAERDGFYKSDIWLKTLLPELKEKGFVEKVDVVYTVSPSK